MKQESSGLEKGNIGGYRLRNWAKGPPPGSFGWSSPAGRMYMP